MSYPVIEISRDDGRPIELYKFSYTFNNWYYTSADRPIDYTGNTYTPAPIKRSKLQPTSDPTKANLTISLPYDSPVGQIFRVQPPSELVIVTIFGAHYLDNSFTVLWKGRIMAPVWRAGSTLDLTSESVFSSLKRAGLRRRFQYGCPFALYGEDCGVDRNAYKEDTNANGISGLVLTAAAAIGKPDNWYAGGYVTWTNNTNNNTERRMIRSSVGASGALTMSAVPIGLQAGQTVSIYPGCDHTLEGTNGCASKFNNFLNFGGTPYIPTKNPFASTIY